MPTYMKLEEDTQESSFYDDMMGFSLLALLLSPWAIAGLVCTLFEVEFITPGMTGLSAILLLAAVPKLLQLLLVEYSNNRHHEAGFTDSSTI